MTVTHCSSKINSTKPTKSKCKSNWIQNHVWKKFTWKSNKLIESKSEKSCTKPSTKHDFVIKNDGSSGGVQGVSFILLLSVNIWVHFIPLATKEKHTAAINHWNECKNMHGNSSRWFAHHILGRVRCTLYLNGNHHPKYVNQPNKNIHKIYVTLKCIPVS